MKVKTRAGRRSRSGLWATVAALAATEVAAGPAHGAEASTVERWGVFEVTLQGPSDGNPFADVDLRADFTQGTDHVTVRGFYDGGGTYKIRFSPQSEGTWSYTTLSNRKELAGKTGSVEATKASPGNRGPVRVKDKFHFAYADGTPYYPIGTTVYALPHPPEKVQQTTLATMAKSPFNKIRLCVFPKWYVYNNDQPQIDPFEKREDGRFDLFRPNPAFYRLLERRIAELQKLGVEVDLILFHPYDEGHWGFDRMGSDADQQYLRYVLARLSSIRNVWWSMANEWDFVKRKTVYDWNKLFDIIEKEDPYKKLCSIHNGHQMFDHSRSGITHASVQNADPGKTPEWQKQWGKPVIDDECQYEGDIEQSWGNIAGQELIHRFWQGFIRGGYVGHGETFRSPDDILWWAKGGVLRGQSPARIRFLREILEKGGRMELVEVPGLQYPMARQRDSYLMYLGRNAPKFLHGDFLAELEKSDPKLKGARWRFQVIDPWAMKTTPVPGEHQGKFEIPLPAKPYMALRIVALSKDAPKGKAVSQAPAKR